MIISKIPIFITVRANTDEILRTNKEALKFSYLFIKDLELFSQTYIISDKQEMLDYAKELGFTNTILYTCGNEKDLLYLEYLSDSLQQALYHFLGFNTLALLSINSSKESLRKHL